MKQLESYIAASGAPQDRSFVTLDANELPPPQPLRNTLEQLAEMDDSIILVQLNDRRPQHLYPKLDKRGYEYETVEPEDVVVTIIWWE